jgi:ribosomal protein L17
VKEASHSAREVRVARSKLSPELHEALKAELRGEDIGPVRRAELLRLLVENPALKQIYRNEAIRARAEFIDPYIQGLITRSKHEDMLNSREVAKVAGFFGSRPDSLTYLEKTDPALAAAIRHLLQEAATAHQERRRT